MSERVKAFIQILRPINCLMMGFAVIIGELITLKGNLLLFQSMFFPSTLGFVTAFTLTGGSMAINDYFDRVVDAVNEPSRPIPKGLIKPSEALGFAYVLGTVGLFSAFSTSLYVLSFYVLIVAVLSFLLSVYYNTKGKKHGFWGNLMVSGCVAVPFIYGAFVVGVPPGVLLLMFALMAFLSNTGREIVKGIADIEGDRIRKIETLAIKLNPREAAYVAFLFYVFAVGLSFLPLIFSMVSYWYLPPITVSWIGFLVTAFWTVKNPSTKNAKKMKKITLVWMGFGLLAFVFGSVLT